MNAQDWEVPEYRQDRIKDKVTKYCLCIPVINEGDKIVGQLKRILQHNINRSVDVIICDGGSTDGSMDIQKLKKLGVNVLLTKIGPGKLSAQLRMGYAFALQEGYEGIITIDGNGKDNVEAVHHFIKALDDGYDLVQGSRFIKGGKAINTPFVRHIAVKIIHVPIISLVGKFKYTDTTNGYRAYSKRFLVDKRVQPFRNIFNTYELLAYLSVRAPQLQYKIKEVPVIRRYPEKGKIPTKISFIKGNTTLLSILWGIVRHHYDPK